MPFTVAKAPTLVPPFILRNFTNFTSHAEYIFDVTTANNRIAVSASNHEIKLFDPNTLSLTQTFRAHTAKVTEIQGRGEHFVLSGSEDGHVLFWDVRNNSSQPAVTFRAGAPLLSFSVNCSDTVLAAGTALVDPDASIIFWDVRTASVLKIFAETHADDVTQTRFHPTNPHALLTGSEDGVLAFYNITDFEEDEALLSAVNTGASIARIGFFGPAADYAYSLSSMNTLGLWRPSEGESLYEFGDVRTVKDIDPTAAVDYAIDCKFDEVTQRLYLICGSNQGDISLLHVSLGSLEYCQTLSGGHTEVVRSVFWDTQSKTLVSGGEDGKLCQWNEQTGR